MGSKQDSMWSHKAGVGNLRPSQPLDPAWGCHVSMLWALSVPLQGQLVVVEESWTCNCTLISVPEVRGPAAKKGCLPQHKTLKFQGMSSFASVVLHWTICNNCINFVSQLAQACSRPNLWKCYWSCDKCKFSNGIILPNLGSLSRQQKWHPQPNGCPSNKLHARFPKYGTSQLLCYCNFFKPEQNTIFPPTTLYWIILAQTLQKTFSLKQTPAITIFSLSG